MYNVLLVEDEKMTMEINRGYLLKKGLTVTSARSIAEAKEKLKHFFPDCAVLDILLPDGNGLDLCHYIKETFDCPVIFLSNLSKNKNKIDGFIEGGDDYVVKPVSPEEIFYRILARVRTSRLTNKHLQVETIGVMQLNHQTNECYYRQKKIRLTDKEFSILSLLAHNCNKNHSAQQIYHAIWGIIEDFDTRTVHTHVSNLRKKLEEIDEFRGCIKTVWGVGYRFSPPHSL